MNENSNNYVLILAGGKGKRLWPVSREAMPKQFLDFFSTGKTQLQQTWERALTLVPKENIFIATNRQYGEITRNQLPDAIEENILEEPIARNTAASLGWVVFRIYIRNPKGCLVVMPSDHAVMDMGRFTSAILQAFDYVKDGDRLLTLGVIPTRPEPGYGYVQKGEPDGNRCYKVKSFTEKPEREFATMFMESGEFLWNTGIFCASVTFYRNSLAQVFPIAFRKIEGDKTYLDISKERAFIEETFPKLPNLSIESGILDRTDRNYVMEADFGWTDLGTWHSIYESMVGSNDGNNITISSRALFDNCHNNIVKLPDDHVAVIGNLGGYIVAEKGNVLLICKKEESSSLIRKYRNEVKMEFGDEFV